MRFANPEFLLLFLLFLLPSVFGKGSMQTFVRFTRGIIFEKEKPSKKALFYKTLKILKYLSFALIIAALARPQKGINFEDSKEQGIDIMIALDISSSMRSIDFKPLNRLEAAKNTAADFIKERKYDRIGLVVFSGLAFTQCPLTTDKESLLNFIKKISMEDIHLDGTAIGSAIVTSVNRLKDSKAKGKTVILITDGNNNMGEVDPVTASRIAANYGIKIYAIGVGSLEGAIYEIDDGFFGKRQIRDNRSGLNENALKEIAENTGGNYFRATDIQSFKESMKQIDDLEKTDIKVRKFTSYEELYKNLALAALALLFLIMLLENTVLRKLP
ncbi:MAG: VWA domain-containing protein [Endomicrobium sp.]|jgi:Ca-activated chloride channel family protein|nr:VWA domain-containing protein [Endomicrobium sp.]